MFAWILGNSLVTALLLIVVWAVCRRNATRPAFCHLLWVLAFLSLALPPVPVRFSPGTWLRTEVSSWLPASAAQETGVVVESAPPVDVAALLSETAQVAADPTVVPAIGASAQLEPDAKQPFWAGWSPWLALWALGALALIACAAWRIFLFHGSLRKATAASAPLRQAVLEVARRMEVSAPEIRILEGVGTPAIWCFGKPLLLWPGVDGQAVRHEGEDSLIAHELAHLARRDHWIARLEVLAMGVFWWNPLFWIIRHRIHDYAELSCDAWALWAFPTRRRVYAEALIDAQERTLGAPMALQGLCATNSEFKNFERRLSMIMSKNVSRQVSKGAAATALLATLLVLPGFTMQEAGQSSEATCDAAPSGRCVDSLVEVKELSEKANKLFYEKRLEEALAVFELVLKLDPENGEAHSRLGYMQILFGEHEQAREHFSKQLALGYRAPVAIYNLACVSSLQGEIDKGLALLEKSVRRGFVNAKLMGEDSDLNALRERDAYRKTLELAEKSMALREKLEKYEDDLSMKDRVAISSYLADIATEDGELQDECGLLFLKAGDYVAGRRAFERQLAVGHERARANYNLACAHALLGSQPDALQALERAVELGMAHPEVLEDQDLASLHEAKGFAELAERLAAPRKFQDQLKGDLWAGDVAKAQKSLSDLIDSREAAERARAWAAYKLGSLQVDKQPKEALKSFERAVALGYSPTESAFGMGQALVAMGDFQAAARHFDKAVILGYSNTQKLGKALANCGLKDTKEGAAMLERAEWHAKEGDYEKKMKEKMESLGAEWRESIDLREARKKKEQADAVAKGKGAGR